MRDSITKQIKSVKDLLANGTLKQEHLDDLLEQVESCSDGSGTNRQRLLYLHASGPGIRSSLIGHALHEPVAGSRTQIDPLEDELPYGCVHDAILDSWRVIHFPQQLAPFEDREIDIMGYEFILEKIEVYDD